MAGMAFSCKASGSLPVIAGLELGKRLRLTIQAVKGKKGTNAYDGLVIASHVMCVHEPSK